MPPCLMVVLATRDAELERAVLAAGAAVGRAVEVVDEVGSLATAWGEATSLLVGWDLAAAVVDRALPRRSGIYVVGPEDARQQACGWSMPLGAAVLLLPEGARWLSSVITGAASTEAAPVVIVGVLGGSGGVGASTLAAGLALAAARSRRKAALVDVDPTGGGADLLFGAEDVPGWRWARLRTARGQIGDLTGKLPAVDGVDLVSMSRVGDTDVGRDAVASVVSSLERTHEVVVLDIGRGLAAAALEGVRLADRLVLACAQEVRSVAAARAVLATVKTGATAGAVVRLRPGAVVAPGAVADALGLPLWGTMPDDRALAVAADRGVPSGAQARRWEGACDRVLAHLAPSAPSGSHRARRALGWWRR